MARRLSPEDRDFLEQVRASMFANPFSQARRQHDAEVARMGVDSDHREEIILTLCMTLYQRLEGLGPGVKVGEFEPEDGRLVLYGVLFWAMHAWWEEFERLIQMQRVAGDVPVPAPFVSGIFREFERWGIDQEQSVRFVGMFHQIHRAYTFIGTELPGQSQAMHRLRERLWMNVFSHDLELYFESLWNSLGDFSTFLLGASGTGKGSAARALGQSGWIAFDPKRGQFSASWTTMMVPINLSEFPESLVESELFGHAKGAFTGALTAHEGVFSRCSPHGVLFVDEIGEVSEHIQVKLLNVLQERRYSPVGDHTPRHFEGRVVAATNRTLAEVRGPGGLRDDFFYRLCSDVIELPGLAERLAQDAEELPTLVGHILGKVAGGERLEALTRRVCEVLWQQVPRGYSWPGNVRELEQAVRQVVLTGELGGMVWAKEPEPQGGEVPLEEIIRRACVRAYEQEGSFEEAARVLEVDRRTVSKYVKQAGQGEA